MDPTRKNWRGPGEARWCPGSPLGKDREGLYRTEKGVWQSMWKKEVTDIWDYEENEQKFEMPLDICLVFVAEHYTSCSLHELAGVPNSSINYGFNGILGTLVHMCFRAHQIGSRDERLTSCPIGRSGLEEGYLAVVARDAGKPHKMKRSLFCVWNHTHFHNI